LNICDYGIVPNTEDLPGIPARVTAVHKERYEIACVHGITYARLKTKEYYVDTQAFPTAGDFVMVNYMDNGDSQIIATLPRRTFFSRREPGPIPREQAVAANFDYVFIMQSLNLDFNPKRLERYLTLAWQSGATPVILLTKADLAEDYWDYLTQVERVATGVNIHVVSAHTGAGLPRLNAYLQPGKTVVFLGSSGVGKSTLVNALAGEEIMAVSAIREDDSKGRHTTTHRQLIRLKSGVKWHDGEVLTAADVKFTVDALVGLAGSAGTLYDSYVSNIASVRVDRSDSAREEILTDKDSDLTLFVRDAQLLEYIILRCVVK